MFSATRRWFRRNRTPIAIGVGVLGAGYVVTQYVLGKINEARERMSSDRIAKENLRRRFEQNQEDCTFTVLALLPTVTNNILEAMNTEKITYEIQQVKGGRAAPGGPGSTASPPRSIAETNLTSTDDDGRSMISMQSESGIHASQYTTSAPAAAALSSAEGSGGGAQDGGQAAHRARKTKRQLWDELTMSSITRAFTLVYTLALLTMLTRIQLNLLGRRSYLSSVVSLATGSPPATISLENNDDGAGIGSGEEGEAAYGTDFDINRKYLTFSWWLLNRGYADVMRRVEAAVRQVFGHLSPRDQLTAEAFASLTRRARALVEGGGGPPEPGSTAEPARWLAYLLPPRDMEDFVLRESGVLDGSPVPAAPGASAAVPVPAPPAAAASLRRLLDETADLIESPTFAHVLGELLDAGFGVLLDRKLAQGAFDLPPPPPPTERVVDLDLVQLQSLRQVLLPRILSVLTRQAHAIGNGMPNEYLQEMEGVRDLEGFAAVVYSSNWEAEIRADEADAAAAATGAAGSRPMAGAVHVGAEDATPATTAPTSSLPQSPASTLTGTAGGGEESTVLVDAPGAALESAWAKATEPKP